MKEKLIDVIFVLFFCLFFCFCAKEGFPPGGPVDTTPPEILSVFPPADSTYLNTDIDIEIQFSEAMNKEKTKASVFMSPGVGERLSYKWKGKKLIIKPTKLLLKDKTYVVTVGTGAMDIHNNHLAESYCFAFSTGEKIDQGEIYGKVFFPERISEKISIWAYSLNGESEPNPSTDIPEYVTQSDNEGDYKLEYLSLGRYRLFAVGDMNSDLRWDIDEERVGVAPKDVRLSSEKSSQISINFTPAKKDSIGPSLVDCKLLDKNKLQLEFDEEPDSFSLFELENYQITCEDDSSQFVKINYIYLRTGDKRKPCLWIDGVEAKKRYGLIISNLTDKWSNEIDTSYNSCTFLGTDKIDTIPPSIFSTSPKNMEYAVSLDMGIKLFFIEPMDVESVEKHFFLKDSSEVIVNGSTKWIDPTIFVFAPYESLQSSSFCRAGLEGEKVFDLAGNQMTDSLFEVAFTTLNPDTLGQISGRIGISDSSYLSGQIIITAKQVGNGSGKIYHKVLNNPGAYRFTTLLPGKYTIDTFMDLDGDTKLNLGNPFPFVRSEPKILYPDTIVVRSRWETEGVNLVF